MASRFKSGTGTTNYNGVGLANTEVNTTTYFMHSIMLDDYVYGVLTRNVSGTYNYALYRHKYDGTDYSEYVFYTSSYAYIYLSVDTDGTSIYTGYLYTNGTDTAYYQGVKSNLTLTSVSNTNLLTNVDTQWGTFGSIRMFPMHPCYSASDDKVYWQTCYPWSVLAGRLTLYISSCDSDMTGFGDDASHGSYASALTDLSNARAIHEKNDDIIVTAKWSYALLYLAYHKDTVSFTASVVLSTFSKTVLAYNVYTGPSEYRTVIVSQSGTTLYIEHVVDAVHYGTYTVATGTSLLFRACAYTDGSNIGVIYGLGTSPQTLYRDVWEMDSGYTHVSTTPVHSVSGDTIQSFCCGYVGDSNVITLKVEQTDSTDPVYSIYDAYITSGGAWIRVR